MGSNPTSFSEQRLSGRVIAFASAKGGTGKTVLAASTALALLRSGKRVLVIDGDFSTRGLSLFVLGDILHTSDLVIRSEECLAEFFLSALKLEDIHPRRIDRNGIEYHILFSNQTLWRSGVPEKAILSDLRLEPHNYVNGISRLLSHFREEYDYIIIDTRGGYDFTSAVPALLSDTYVIVLEPDRVSLEQIQGFEKATVEFAANYDLRIPLRGFIINKASFDPKKSEFVEHLTRTYEIKTYGIIPADIHCIRAYEKTDSPIQRFPYSDFAFWCMRTIEALIAPRINWKDQEHVDRFAQLREKIGKDWAGRKRTDKILSWLPFIQLLPIIVALIFYAIFRYVPSTFALLAMYASVAVFITCSMVGWTLYGLEWFSRRDVSAFTRRVLLGAAGTVITLSMLLMVIDIPQHILLISAPPQALAVGESASKGASVLQGQASEVVQAWTGLAVDTIDRSEGRISTDVEAFLRNSLNIPVSEAMPPTERSLISVLSRQIMDAARSRVDSAAANVLATINTEGNNTRSAIDEIVRILEHPRATVDTRVQHWEPPAPKDLQFPSVFEILDTATRSALDAAQLPSAKPRPDSPPPYERPR